MPSTQSKTERKAFNEPKPLPPLSEKDIARFWSKVDKTPGQGPKGECWGWTGGKDKNGYGKFSTTSNGRHFHLRAHRVGHFIQNGLDTTQKCTLHECDYPPCVRGEHLKPGSNIDNLRERTAKGRTAKGVRHGLFIHPERLASGDRNGSRLHPERLCRGDRHPTRTNPEVVPRGSRSGNTKFTESDVIEIRRLFESGELRKCSIAKQFGVTKSTISKICNRQAWKHI